jgi:hypothetical protein
MQRIIILIYVIGAAAWSLVTSITQSQPALFWINLFAPDAGDTYNVKLVWLLTMLMLLLPGILILLVMKMFRKGGIDTHLPGTTGILITRKKQLQSAFVGIPIFINGAKAGVVDSGKTAFFPVPSGNDTVQAGSGKPASEQIEFQLSEGKCISFVLEIGQAGLNVSYILKRID